MNNNQTEKARRKNAARRVVILGFSIYAVVLFAGFTVLLSSSRPEALVTARPESVSHPPSSSPPPDAVELNSASLDALQTLPGIGPTLAQAIVDYRNKQPFYFKEDLMNVRGIGEKRFRALEPFIAVAVPTPSPLPESSAASH